jgi:hypothetical protein
MSFCTLEIPNAETAAVLQALVNQGFKDRLTCDSERTRVAIIDCIQGGEEGFNAAAKVAIKFKTDHIWRPLDRALEKVGAHHKGKKAPWMPNQAPNRIEDFTISYSEEGIKFGCSEISLETMEAMVKKCKGE